MRRSDSALMGKLTVEVGEREKHTLTVDLDWAMKRILIELDGEKLTDEYYYSPLAKKFSFDVGRSEVHKVEVSLGASLPIIAIVKRRAVKVLVDGKPVQT
jgi:hypothetical protein